MIGDVGREVDMDLCPECGIQLHHAIDGAIRAGAGLRTVATTYGVSHGALARHNAHTTHTPPQDVTDTLPDGRQVQLALEGVPLSPRDAQEAGLIERPTLPEQAPEAAAQQGTPVSTGQGSLMARSIDEIVARRRGVAVAVPADGGGEVAPYDTSWRQ